MDNIDIRKEFAKSREELDDHRDSINQNTNEIQALYDYIYELDAKIEKMTERLDEIMSVLMPSCSLSATSTKLTKVEQECFLIIYSSDAPLKMSELARSIGMPVLQTSEKVMQLRLKGIPLLSQIVDGEQFLSLDLKFKDEQAKRNILQIPESMRVEVAKRIRH